MGVLNVMDYSGHSELNFDKTTGLGMAEAEAKFKELVGLGFTMYEKKDWRDESATPPTVAEEAAPTITGKIVREFNPDAAEIVARPRIVGG